MKQRRRRKRTNGWLAVLLFGILGVACMAASFRPAPPVERTAGSVRASDAPSCLLDAPYLNQRARYPTGCESVAAVMALQYWDIAVTPEAFIDRYLPQGRTPWAGADGQLYGDDPNECFLGSPYSESGWGCYAPVIARSLERALAGRPYRVAECTGISLPELCSRYLDRGIPVIVWGTIDMQPAREGKTWTIAGTSRQFTWKTPLHAMLLVGYDETCYYFNDPWREKNTPYRRAQAERAFEEIGSQAVAVLPA